MLRDRVHPLACAIVLASCGSGSVTPDGAAGGSAQAVGAEFFVATTGSDSSAGTASAPFATLDRAQAAVRSLKSVGLPTGGVAVTVRGGVYRRSSTLVLTGADSGTADRPVIWRSYPGETVRITGGRSIGGWTTVTSSDPNWSRVRTSAPLYKASIGLTGSSLMANFMGLTSPSATAAGDPSTGGIGISSSAVPFEGDQGVDSWRPHPALAELTYDGQMMTLARWPKRSDDPAVPTSWLKATPGASATQFTSGADVTSRGWGDISGLSSMNKPWAHVVGGGYHDDVLQMTSASGTSIAVASGPQEGIEGSSNQGRWAAVNLLEELTEPAEYWMDRDAGVVYFRPPGDANPASHETVVSELSGPLVWADATSQYVIVDGLIFEATQSFLVRVAGQQGPHRQCLRDRRPLQVP
jgi:ribosomal protein S11